MSTSEHNSLDGRLTALFGALNTRPDFNARLLDRLHREVVAEEARAREARRLEQLRHGVAKQELRSWRGWQHAIARLVTLETVGIAALAVITVTSTWSAEQIREFLPAVVTVVGLALAFAPAIVPLIRKRP